MGISTGIGLVSGINIEDIVSKMMDIEHRPIDQLESRIDDINTKKTAFSELTAYLLQLKITAGRFYGDSNVFSSRLASSSNTSVLSATADRDTALGNYAFTVKSLVQSHHLVSRGFANVDSTLGTGTITVETGNGNVDRATPLDTLNGGSGVAAGSVLIADRSGNSAVVDFTGATSVQDILDTINTTAGLGVTASVEGDHIVLNDTTGSTSRDLTVEEVQGGTTAGDLGLVGSVSSNTLTGSNIVSLGSATYLDSLNDQRGVRHVYGLDDLRITRRDGVALDIDISSAETLQDIIDLVNNHADNADGRLTASISAAGTGLALVDSTGGTGNLSVEALNGSGAAGDLGLIGSVAADTLTGKRVIAKLNTVLLSSLDGGRGVAAGSVNITDRSGASDTVDLSGAETLQDVIDTINGSSVAVTASLNSSGTGLVLTDTSGGTGTFSVAEAGSTTAADLGILSSVDSSTLRGSNLQLQYISERTLMSSLGGGAGVFKGSFRITDRSGQAATVDLSQEDDTRIEDVISEINSRGIGVSAAINSTGDGILLTDTSGGTGDLRVVDLNGGTTARDLNIAGTASSADPTHIDGSFEYKIDVTSGDTIENIVAKIEDSGAPVSANIINDGSATNPYRIGLVSSSAGSTGRMVIDTGGLDLGLTTTQQARDAVVLYGKALPGSTPMVIRSTSNTITGLVDGLTINLVGTSDTPTSVSVRSDDDTIVNTVSDFVDQWNAAIGKIQDATKYDAESQTAGPLLGDPAIMRVEDMLNQMISYNATGTTAGFNRLSRVGVSFMETGKIIFSPNKLREALASNRSDVETLFTKEDTGLGAHFSSVLDNLTDEYDGVLKKKSDLFNDQVKVLQSQIDNINSRLIKVRARLYKEFYSMEETLARLQTQRSAIENMPNYLLGSNGGNKKE